MSALLPSASDCCSPCDNSTLTTTTLEELITTIINDIHATQFFEGSTPFEFVSIPPGEILQTLVTVTGAVLGDFAVASYDLSFAGITLTAEVSDVDETTVTWRNNTSGSIDITEGTLRVLVIKREI